MNLLSQLTRSEKARLFEELNYMNLEEIRGFCSERGIPYRIVAEYPNGKVKVTKDADRKPIVLARVRRYLTTGHVGQPTSISASIVREQDPPARLGPRDRLYYRWYAKEFEGVMRLLRDLTAGRFRDGAVARVLAMECWTRGEAPTFEQFARSWTKAKAEQHRLLTPEYAVPTTGWNGDDEIVDRTAEQESDEDGPTRSYPRRGRTIQKPIRQIPERTVPAPTPEFAETRRCQWTVHQRARLHPHVSPETGEQMEHPEMKCQHDSDHSDPPHGVLVSRRNRPGDAEQKRDADHEFRCRRDPFARVTP